MCKSYFCQAYTDTKCLEALSSEYLGGFEKHSIAKHGTYMAHRI